MVITWLGLSCFKISSGNLTLATDPYGKQAGPTAPRGGTDIVISSNIKNDNYNNWTSLGGPDAFVIDGPGEFDVKGLFVRGIPAENSVTIYSIRMEDIRLGFLGSLKQKELTDQQLEDLGEIDVLFVPVGGKSVCDAEEAVTIVNQCEPRMIVPMHYAQKDIKLPLDKLDVFLKEMGSTKAVPQDKLTIKKSNFAESGESEVIVLTS